MWRLTRTTSGGQRFTSSFVKAKKTYIYNKIKHHLVRLRTSHGNAMQERAIVPFHIQLYRAGGISHLALRAINVVKTNLPRVEC